MEPELGLVDDDEQRACLEVRLKQDGGESDEAEQAIREVMGEEGVCRAAFTPFERDCSLRIVGGLEHEVVEEGSDLADRGEDRCVRRRMRLAQHSQERRQVPAVAVEIAIVDEERGASQRGVHRGVVEVVETPSIEVPLHCARGLVATIDRARKPAFEVTGAQVE